jgi:hypothetical protein
MTEHQEHKATSHKIQTVHHAVDDHYVINMHALHNAYLIRETLPRSLMAPSPLFSDRENVLRDFAAQLRVSGPLKRAATAAKAKETRERNKQAREAAKGKTSNDVS